MRLIDADALELDTEWSEYHDGFISYSWLEINNAPTIEPKRGEWVLKDGIYGVAYCSECDYELHTNNTNYCPNCGADMREREGE